MANNTGSDNDTNIEDDVRLSNLKNDAVKTSTIFDSDNAKPVVAEVEVEELDNANAFGAFETDTSADNAKSMEVDVEEEANAEAFGAFETDTTADGAKAGEAELEVKEEDSVAEFGASETDSPIDSADDDGTVVSGTKLPQNKALPKTAIDNKTETETETETETKSGTGTEPVENENETTTVTESEVKPESDDTDEAKIPANTKLLTLLTLHCDTYINGTTNNEDGTNTTDQKTEPDHPPQLKNSSKSSSSSPSTTPFSSTSLPSSPSSIPLSTPAPTGPTAPETSTPELFTQSPHPTSSPSTPTVPPSPHIKNRSFQNLKSYEAKRRQIYTAKLTSSSFYWRAFRELLSSSLQETERAEVVVRAGLVAAVNYHQVLHAAAEDRLDASGKPVLDMGKARKLKEERRKKYSRLGSGGKSPFALLQDKLGVEKEGKADSISENAEAHSKDKYAAEESQSPSLLNRQSSRDFDVNSMVQSMLESQSAMADRFQENISFVSEVSLKKLTQLKQELESEIYIITMLGDAIVEELERAEQDVQDAWSAYYTMTHRTFDTASNSSPGRKRIFPGNFTPDCISDMWIVEMHYRMSVAYLTTTWEQSSTELSKLFQSMKEVECNRRFRLRELLLVHMQRQERLWLSIPALITPVVKDLMDRPTDIPTVEREVQSHIRSRAADIKRNKDNTEAKERLAERGKSKSSVVSHTSKTSKVGEMDAGPGLTCAEELDPNYELVSPLMSDLLLKADVVEKKSDSGIIGLWKTTLVIATSDSFLHFFDIPQNSGVRPGSAAEVAFQALVPPIAVPSEDMIKNGKVLSGRSWFEYLIPADSVSLKRSMISLNETKGDCIFEVTETVESHGAAKIFHMKSTRKFSIKLFSNHEMVSWLLALGMAI